jgi:hypothetical protein
VEAVVAVLQLAEQRLAVAAQVQTVQEMRVTQVQLILAVVVAALFRLMKVVAQ